MNDFDKLPVFATYAKYFASAKLFVAANLK